MGRKGAGGQGVSNKRAQGYDCGTRRLPECGDEVPTSLPSQQPTPGPPPPPAALQIPSSHATHTPYHAHNMARPSP